MLILKICAVIIVIGLAILAFDKFYVRRDEPSKAERLDELGERLALVDQSDDEPLNRRLLALLQGYGEIAGSPQRINTILSRRDPACTLSLIEFDTREFALYRGNGQTSRVNVPLLAILLEFTDGTALPAWIQSDDHPPPTPPLNAEALARLERMADFRMAMGDSHVLFVSQLQAPALVQSINQSVSGEFHAGLLNSALQIDVQRAIDIVNLMDSDLPQVARFYKIDVPKPQIDIPDTPISKGLDQIVSDTHDQIAAQREQWAVQDAERKAQWEQKRQALRAERERRAAERKAESEKRMAELRAKMDAATEAAKTRNRGSESESND